MAAAHTLRGVDCVVYEARNHAGGHSSSFHIEGGFTFDEGPHVSFTPHERIARFLAQSVNNRFFEYPTYATNYFQGHILKHPVQCNLYGLPGDLVTRCIADFVRAQYEDKRPLQSYKDWSYRGFGETVSEVFTRPYTRKYWNLELEQLTTDWVSERIYAPKLEEVLSGALTPPVTETEEHYYMTKFRYPETGGFGAYTDLLAKDAPIEFNKRAVEINLEHRKLSFADGSEAHFDHLISTLPLPVFYATVHGCSPARPRGGREAVLQLALHRERGDQPAACERCLLDLLLRRRHTVLSRELPVEVQCAHGGAWLFQHPGGSSALALQGPSEQGRSG